MSEAPGDAPDGLIRLEPGQRLVLDAPLLLLKGEVQIFAQLREAGEGPRWAFGGLGPGALLLGAPEEREALFATGEAELLPAGSIPPEAALAWAALLATGLGRLLGPRPALQALLRPGQSRALPDGAGFALAEPGWLSCEGGAASLYGLVPLPDGLPLPPQAWASLEGAALVAVRPAGTADLAALRALTANALEALPLIRGLAEVDARNRERLRAAREAAEAHATAERLAGILGNPPPPPPVQADDSLFRVMQAVAAAQGARLSRPAAQREADLDRLPEAEEIARASDLRLLPVRLPPGWWRRDLGPLLGRDARGQPVALLPGQRGYRLRDGAGAERRVDAALAAGLAPQAGALLAPLPGTPLGLAALLRFSLQGSSGDAAVILLAMLAGALLGQLMPLATSLAFALLVPAGLSGALAQLGLAMAVLAGLLYAARLTAEATRQRVEARAGARLGAALWDRILRLPLPVLRRYATGDLAARTGGAIALPAALRGLAASGGGALAMLLSSAAMMLWYAPAAGAAALGWSLLGLLLAGFAAWRQERAFADGEALEGLADSLVLQYVQGVAKLRVAAAESRAFRRWADRFAALRGRSVRARAVGYWHDAWLAASPVLLAALAYWLLAPQHDPARPAVPPMPLSQVMGFLSAMGLHVAAAAQLAQGLLALGMQLPGWRYARPLLEPVPERAAGGADPGRLSGALDLVGLHFAYPGGPPVLRGVQARIAPGEFVAITGLSGGGKSTLLRLALGLERPQAGAILFDGQELGGLDPVLLRRQIGTVLQGEKLPAGTILEAVRGLSGAGEAEIWQALRDAAIAEEVAAMPMRLHTLITDGSRTLSGGQVQRLLLARALAQRPALLLLDEATSALDGATEAAVTAALDRLAVTRLVVAHRLPTIRRADRILVLDQGRVVEAGSYDALLAAGRGFARLVAASGAPG
ncbi:ATP-binding cassette domain-containing protein [Pseudoroseomonas cervicalis]|uniref:ATP-binding cassette domain-containing protein n=1 Tax=Teichococcus cervicalis TaxID=204525 RepID=UPI00278066C7|nr:ATP-binding cassette domain-containing protein [Pseudoroseomonas cervicalis]MDQ1081613.1 ABC-type bacteriocin/lantibiotic exporter with double-glycine peptidase domain [Pseudoroseomonas cervicalis]